jgi:hypothetical protein
MRLKDAGADRPFGRSDYQLKLRDVRSSGPAIIGSMTSTRASVRETKQCKSQDGSRKEQNGVEQLSPMFLQR